MSAILLSGSNNEPVVGEYQTPLAAARLPLRQQQRQQICADSYGKLHEVEITVRDRVEIVGEQCRNEGLVDMEEVGIRVGTPGRWESSGIV